MSIPKPVREKKTVEDLMEVAGLGRDSVREGIRAGQLPGYLVGHRYVIPAKAFEDFEHGRWRPSAPPPRQLRRRKVKNVSPIRHYPMSSQKPADAEKRPA